jgi:hypothetical protein
MPFASQVNVCGIPGCSDGDRASHCLPPSLLLYLKVLISFSSESSLWPSYAQHVTCSLAHTSLQDIISLCSRRPQLSCPTLHASDTSSRSSGRQSSSAQLVLSRDAALLRIASYVIHHAAAVSSAATLRSARKIHYVTGRSFVKVVWFRV